MKKNLLFVIIVFISTVCMAEQKVTSKDLAPNQKDIALQLYSVRDDISKDYEGTLKKVGEMGFTHVEAANYNDGLFYGKTPAEFKSDIEKNGMNVLSSHTSKQLSEKELASKDFSESLRWWDKCIDAHKAAGMTYIVAPWMEVPKNL